MKKHHSSPRNLRRAAERKARKEAHKALKRAAEQANLLQSPAAGGSTQPSSCPLTAEARKTLQLDSQLENTSELQNIEFKTMAAGATAMANWKDLLEDDRATEKILNITNDPPDSGDEQPEKISDARLNANRANSKRSTGPKTLTGRINSSQNRRIHGLTPGCRFLVLKTEDEGAFLKLRENLMDEHKPVSQSETTIVEDMAQHIWLRERGRNFQNEALDEETGKVIDEKKFFLYERYCATHDAAFKSCIVALSRIRKERELVRLGFVRMQLEDMKGEIREKVQRLVEKCRQTGDWTGFGDTMFAYREEIAQKYKPIR